MQQEKTPFGYYQPLFDHLNEEHGIIATESQMADIISLVEKLQYIQHPAKSAVWVKASEFKFKETEHRPYRFQDAPGEEYDYGEIYITEDEGEVFLDVDHENEYIPQNDGRWLKYDILSESLPNEQPVEQKDTKNKFVDIVDDCLREGKVVLAELKKHNESKKREVAFLYYVMANYDWQPGGQEWIDKATGRKSYDNGSLWNEWNHQQNRNNAK